MSEWSVVELYPSGRKAKHEFGFMGGEAIGHFHALVRSATAWTGQHSVRLLLIHMGEVISDYCSPSHEKWHGTPVEEVEKPV